MKIKNYISIISLCFTINLTNAQNLGVSATGATPNNASIIDLNTGNTFTSPNGKGLLPPNVALTGRLDIITVTAPPASLLVYNTATANSGSLSVTPGFYYWDGTIWVAFAGAGSKNWALLGNAGTVAGTNFLGTTDAQDLVVKTNNTERIRVLSTGNVGIGTSAPTASLHIVATATNTGFQLNDGTQGAGKLLVSDANGKASWAATSGSTTVVNSNVGIGVALPGGPTTFFYTGSFLTAPVSGFYILSTRLLADKAPTGCGGYVAYNLCTSSAAPIGSAILFQDLHTSAGAGSYDCIYGSNIVYLTGGTSYYMWVRYGGSCTSWKLRGTYGEDSFTITLLK